MSEKYPRTPHLPWSPGGTRDDRRIKDASTLVDTALIMTEKMDGSNVCLTSEAVYARSHNGAPSHPSFDALKGTYASIKWIIPKNVSIFGEWCYAVHSIRYPELENGKELSIFAVRDDTTGIWGSWDKVENIATQLGVTTVPVLWEGKVVTVKELEVVTTREANKTSIYGPEREGIVVRSRGSYTTENFDINVAKWVRSDHVQTDTHWSAQKVLRHQN